jgi:pilus assembly protein CpaC
VDGRLKVLTGRSAIVTTERPFKRVATPDNDVAVAKPLTTTTILVTPKKAGSTQLIVWDDDERSQIIDVIVELDTKALAEQLRALLPDSKVEASSANGTIVLKGRVPSAEAAKQAAQVAAPYGAKVLNFLEVSGGQQVMLQVRFAEVSRSATSALGVNLFAADGSFFGGSSIGQISPLTELPKARVGDTPAPIGVEFENNRAISPSVTIFAAGQIGSFYLDGLVQALRQNNLLRILDEPNLLTMSGKEADFLAGGSFPIPISGGAETGGSSTVTVEFREFGVKLKFLPVVIGDGKIRLQIAPEVSDLDFTTAVRFNGFVIPGLSQRRVNTTVELADGQSFAIAGLLANNVSATKETVPVLGDLPVVGALFRSVRYQRKETELIVLVTPRLVGPMNPGQVPKLPGEKWRHPKEKDLFLDADLGGPVAAKGPQDTGGSAEAKPPRFHGSYGFNPVTESNAK